MLRGSVAWAGALGLAALLSTSCGDDGSSAQASAGEGGSGASDSPSAGADEGGAAQGASGGNTATSGSGAEPQAGAAQGGAPSQAGAPAAGGEGGGLGDDGVIARDQAMPTGIATDAQNVYWGNSGGVGTIVTCPLTGCDGEPLVIVEAASEVRGIAVDATSIYWLVAANVGDMAPIRKCPLTGCEGPPVTLGDVSSTRPNDIHVIGTVLYYTAWPDFSACTTTNCAQGERASLGAMPVVAVDVAEQSIFVSRYGNQIISRCTRPNCTDLVDLVTGRRAISVAVDPTTLYFSEFGFFGFTVANPGIFKCPIDGCGNAAPEPVVPNVSAFAIAHAGPRLYYTDIEAGIVASVAK